MKYLLLGTTNRGKISELRALLGETDIELKGLDDFEPIPEPLEDGRTFEANADLKAIYYSNAFNCPVLADDSGLEVASLNGRPGVFSARFAGKTANDAQNIAKLLRALRNEIGDRRNAVFRCAMSLAVPDGQILFRVSAACRGKIDVKPSGSNGFGYDPVFIPDGYELSFGDLSDEVKQSLSHRAAAAKKMAQYLSANLGVLT